MGAGLEYVEYSASHAYRLGREALGSWAIRRDTGAQPSGVMAGIERVGICREDLWRYNAQQTIYQDPTPEALADAETRQVLHWARLANEDLLPVLGSEYPVGVGFQIYQPMVSGEAAQTGICSIPRGGAQSLGGHMVCCCGYDLTAGHVLAIGSWGTEFAPRSPHEPGIHQFPIDFLLNRQYAGEFCVIWAEELG